MRTLRCGPQCLASPVGEWRKGVEGVERRGGWCGERGFRTKMRTLRCGPQCLASPVGEWGKGVVVEGRMRNEEKGCGFGGWDQKWCGSGAVAVVNGGEGGDGSGRRRWWWWWRQIVVVVTGADCSDYSDSSIPISSEHNSLT
jgi:hypothetical protein